eukprot:CAMPEP_0194309362 /NCGR_PEP_ID=MMETSP0171-20130528/6331_1 /TAXON_ID=218684 /ORGANISM="Corethron pennatum, Strain L29A3" /LENGTH=356 /DNA_ID=CAMNT_0039062491 /DNA_START=152 /DNA_END=1223 /DNA_ORIENTATION=-
MSTIFISIVATAATSPLHASVSDPHGANPGAATGAILRQCRCHRPACQATQGDNDDSAKVEGLCGPENGTYDTRTTSPDDDSRRKAQSAPEIIIFIPGLATSPPKIEIAFVPSITITAEPTLTPTLSTESPAKSLTESPTESPTVFPSESPTLSPTRKPTPTPTTAPTGVLQVLKIKEYTMKFVAASGDDDLPKWRDYTEEFLKKQFDFYPAMRCSQVLIEDIILAGGTVRSTVECGCRNLNGRGTEEVENLLRNILESDTARQMYLGGLKTEGLFSSASAVLVEVPNQLTITSKISATAAAAEEEPETKSVITMLMKGIGAVIIVACCIVLFILNRRKPDDDDNDDGDHAVIDND